MRKMVVIGAAVYLLSMSGFMVTMMLGTTAPAWREDLRASASLRADLRASGEVCVSYKETWLGPHIDKHWRARKGQFVPAYCPDEDVPAGVNPSEVGQL